jgi:fatty acid desaturase
MLDIGGIVVYGTILSVSSSLIFLLAVLFNPRFARNDLPKDIQDRVPPLTKREKLQSMLFLIPVIALVLGIPLAFGLALKSDQGSDLSYLALAGHLLAVLLITNVFELVVLDWLIYCTLTPKRLVIPNTEGMAGYKDYLHQLRSHARGAVVMVFLSLALAGVVLLIT